MLVLALALALLVLLLPRFIVLLVLPRFLQGFCQDATKIAQEGC